MNNEPIRQACASHLPPSVVVLRALQLGDVLCAVPAWRALRAACPETRVTLVGLPWAASFVRRFDRYLDDFIEFPGFPGFPEQPVDLQAFPPFIESVQASRFDLAIQMQGNGRIANGLVALFGARRLAGFIPADAVPGDGTRIPGAALMPYPEGVSEVRRHLRLMAFLGIPPRGASLEFPLTPEDRREAAVLMQGARLGRGQYVCVHPGARDPERRWPLEKFVTVARAAVAHGLRVVVTGRGEEEAIRAAALAQAVGQEALNLAGRTSLGGLAALMEGSRLLVSNDTGVSHIAAALRVPSVVVFITTDPTRWAPEDRRLHRVVRSGDGDVWRVVQEADSWLSEEHAHVA
jgi:ADP-heptose:LPS heptosyltransferase